MQSSEVKEARNFVRFSTSNKYEKLKWSLMDVIRARPDVDSELDFLFQKLFQGVFSRNSFDLLRHLKRSNNLHQNLFAFAF